MSWVAPVEKIPYCCAVCWTTFSVPLKLHNTESLHVCRSDLEGRNHFIIKAEIRPEALRKITMIPGPPREGSVFGENIFFWPHIKGEPAKNVCTSWERLALSCNVTWSLSERVNLYNWIILLPKKGEPAKDHEERKPTRCNNINGLLSIMDVDYWQCLNMFRASICPYSGVKTTCYRIWSVFAGNVGCGRLRCCGATLRVWSLW